MRNVMVLLQPSYKLLQAQPKWCCAQPNCPHILAVVVKATGAIEVDDSQAASLSPSPSEPYAPSEPSSLLELPKGYGYLRHYEGRPFYGPLEWLGGPPRWVQTADNWQPEKLGFHREQETERQRQGALPIRINREKLPVYIACRAGHAIYEIKKVRGSPK